MPATLYIVATPIGNLEDITLRALRILKEVDLIAAEDTRHSRKLLRHYGIPTPLTPYHEHNEQSRTPELVEALRGGKSLALISDAGTPAISDPGYRLVRACREAGVPVAVVPGPCAAVAALSVSGLPTHGFVFAGFLPAKSKGRREALRRIASAEQTTVFYEAPHRLAATLKEIGEELGEEREVAVARELTKMHEELVRGGAGEVLGHFVDGERVRGEIVLLIAPAAEEAPVETVAEALRRALAAGDRPAREAVKEVARQFGRPGSEVYQEYLKLRESGEE